jgi:hypothetical protein
MTVDLNDALRRYRVGQFTDDDVTHCTGISVRALRELIKLGAIRTQNEGRGPGRVRVCDSTTFKRVSVITAINQTGLNLNISGRLAYLLPLDTFLYGILSPSGILLEIWKPIDPKTGLPPPIAKPKANWFDSDKPAQADPEDDWLLEIYESRFVGIWFNGESEPWIYGELQNERTEFVSWFPFHRQYQILDAAKESSFAKWEHLSHLADQLDLEFINYKYENHDQIDDALSSTAQAIARNPRFKTTINLSLTIKKALRRYLGIQP